MTNREKYAEQILDIVCNGGVFAVSENGEMVNCKDIPCYECIFYTDIGIGCEKDAKRKWCNSKYIEKPKEPKISESDRRFLDYIPEEFEYMTRDGDGTLFIYNEKPAKEEDKKFWKMYALNLICISEFNVSFPMVKWEDSEPWLIEDLKKLEVER